MLRVITILIAVLIASPASAQKPPHRQVQTVCPQCVDQAKAVNQAYDGLNFLWDRKLALERSIAIVEKATADRAAEITHMESATPPSGRALPQQQAIDRLKDVNTEQRGGAERQRRDIADLDRRIAEQNQRIAGLMERLKECEARCKTPPADPPLAATAGATPQIMIRPDGKLSFVVPCQRCQRHADAIMDLNEERAGLMDELLELQLALMFVANGGSDVRDGPPSLAARRRTGMDILEAGDEVMADIADVDRQLAIQWKAFMACIMTCNAVTRQIWTRPLFYGTTIGAGILGGALATGGGSTTGTTPTTPAVSTNSPQAPSPSPPAANPQPTPVPAPAPDAIDAVIGVYRFLSCVCDADPGGHDPFIRLCQLISQFRLTRTGANTARIDSMDPLFTSDWIIDANSQTVDGNARGMVGSSSADLKYSGNVAPPNLFLSLGYSINGTTTRYRVTAVKQ